MVTQFVNPMNSPFVLPVNTAPLGGQIAMDNLGVLWVLLVVGFIVSASVIAWKILRSSNSRPLADQANADRHDLDQAA